VANSTLLQLFQNTMQSMGVVAYGQPTTVISNTNQDVMQLLALVNSAGKALVREHDWQSLQTQYNVTATTYTYTGTTTSGSTSITGMSSIVSLDATFSLTGVGIAQDSYVVTAVGTTVTMNRAATASGLTTITFSKTIFALATDYDRLIDRTQWDKSKHWEMLGPSTPQQQEWLRSGYISTGPRIRFWLKGDYFQIWPPLGTTENLSFEYISKYWIFATGATVTTKSIWGVDTDTCMFSDALMEALIKLKYFEIKGFDTTSLKLAYDQQRDIAKANDSGSPTLSMAPRISTILIGWENIPDSSYGS
jgi:hypothetical protein